MKSLYVQILHDSGRLTALHELELLEDSFVVAYDRLTVLVSNALKTPVSLLSIVSNNYQFFKSSVGLPEPWKSRRQTPLSHSFCQHATVSNQPLIVEDARQNDLVKDNLAIPDLNVIGYLGMPLTLQNGYSLGSLCAIDSSPRAWTQTEIAIMREIAELVALEFETRVEINIYLKTQEDLEDLHRRIEALVDSLDPQQAQISFLDQLRRRRKQLNLDHGLIS